MTSLVTDRSPEPGVWRAVFRNVWWLLTEIPLGQGQYDWLQLRHPINLHKGLSLPFCLLCTKLLLAQSFKLLAASASLTSSGWQLLTSLEEMQASRLNSK